MSDGHRVAERFDFAMDRRTRVFTCTRVLAGEPVLYTVGLWERYKHPELIVMGLHAQSAQRLLNACGEHIKQHGALSLLAPTEGVLDGYPVRVREVSARASKAEHIGYALWYYKEPVPLLQVRWPTREGVFPDEPEAPDDFKALQPLLP